MHIVPILVALTAVYKLLARKVMDTDERINGAEFIVCSTILFPVLVTVSYSLWECWVSLRAGFGVPPLPSIFYEIYSNEELALSPVVITLCIYITLVYLLSLRWWPEWLSKDEIREWQRVRLRKSLWFTIPLFVVDSAYVVYKWYPVWGQWFGLIQG